jgi:predicted adenine nucleotide alpha hydrolase (AANH) superfamily ATPase
MHICCAVCAAGAAERLQQEGHEVVGFFYNPNIHPEGEYKLRLEAARRTAEELSFPLTEGIYLPTEWHQAVRSMESEPEGGKRCPICFKLRLAKTYEFMLENDCQAFTTTLTMGSNKSAQLISRLGEEIGGDKFLQHDFKKREGFKRASLLARQWGLYRQHYCGCEYSLPEPISLDTRSSP